MQPVADCHSRRATIANQCEVLLSPPRAFTGRVSPVRPHSPGTISHASRKSARLLEPNTSSAEVKIKYLC